MRNTERIMRMAGNILLLALVVVWMVPTIGLLISSVRDKDQLAASGWWTALSSQERSSRSRTAGGDEQVRASDGSWQVTGQLLDEGQHSLSGFSVSARDPAAFVPGSTAELDKGGELTVESDGSYVLSSTEPLGDRGQRVYFLSTEPPRLTFENYGEVLASEGVGRAFINTFTVTIPATVIPILVALFAAYAFSWMNFRGRTILFAVVVGLMVVPLQMSLIPLLRMYNGIGDFFGVEGKSYPGIWLAHTGFGLPLAIYLMRNYISSLPSEIIESARIDGAGHFKIFMFIILPLSVPAVASFAIFQFLWVWNDLLVALVFLGKGESQIVLTSKLRELLGSRGDNWEILTAGAFVSIAVPLCVFFALQRFFVRGLTVGSVKG